MRVVLDTNTVLSALLFRKGRLSWLRQVWQQGQLVGLVSEATLRELRRVLNYSKFKLSSTEQEVLLNEYLPFCECVEISNPPPTVPECRDPKDTPFLWLAIRQADLLIGQRAGQADYLVTGDRDITALTDKFSVPIVTGEMFKRIVKRNPTQ